MTLYRVVKKVTLLVGKKRYFLNNIVDVDKVGKVKIKSWLKKGYIAPLGDPNSIDLDDEDEGAEDGELLSPEALEKLPKAKLVVYAKKIGLEGFPAKIKDAELRKLIAEHVEKLCKESEGQKPDVKPGEENA